MNTDDQAGLDLLGKLLAQSDVSVYETDTKIEVSSWDLGFRLVLSTHNLTIMNVLCGHKAGVTMRIVEIKTDGVAYSGALSDPEIAARIESVLHKYTYDKKKMHSQDAYSKLTETLGYNM